MTDIKTKYIPIMLLRGTIYTMYLMHFQSHRFAFSSHHSQSDTREGSFSAQQSKSYLFRREIAIVFDIRMIRQNRTNGPITQNLCLHINCQAIDHIFRSEADWLAYIVGITCPSYLFQIKEWWHDRSKITDENLSIGNNK